MKALVYHGPGLKTWEEVPDPPLTADTDTSTFPVPDGVSDEEVRMLADIGPTGHEVGVLNGRVSPGDTVVVVGAGPIGLAVIMGAQLFSPAHIVAVDPADARLEAASSSAPT